MRPASPVQPRLSLDISDLQAELLRAVNNPPRIGSFLRQLGEKVSARAGSLVVNSRSLDNVRYVEFFPAMSEREVRYQKSIAQVDPYRNAMNNIPPMRFFSVDALVPRHEVQRDPVFANWLRELDAGDAVVARLPVGSDYECRLGLIRAFGEPKFTTSETELLDTLLPPLLRVLEVQDRLDLLSLAEDIAQAHCQQLGHGVVSIGDDGHVQYLNRVAEDLLAKNAAHLCLDGGELRVAHPESGKRFETLVRQCVLTAGSRYVRSGGAVAIPRDGRMPLGITVYPSRRDASSSNVINRGARATVILHDPEHPRADSRAMLREMYGLSAAEAEVCWRLANGQSLTDIAQDTHASAETVRSQLKRVFGKTGTKRQADVVRLVLLGPMSIS